MAKIHNKLLLSLLRSLKWRIHLIASDYAFQWQSHTGTHQHLATLGLLFPITKPKGSDLTVMWWNVYGFEAHSTLALVTAHA